MAYQSFEDLEVWKRGCRQACEIFRTVEKSKFYALKDQMERSGLSVPSNIAEGHDRDSPGDFVRFLRISKGSNAELRTQIYIARELGMLDNEKGKELIAESKEISCMLQGLIRAIQKPSP